MSKTETQKAIEAKIKHDGLQMYKQISSGGFLGEPTYDKRTVYTINDLYKLNAEGFRPDIDLGTFLFNALMMYKSATVTSMIDILNSVRSGTSETPS